MMNTPAQIAENYVTIGKGKVDTPIAKMFMLAIMAGAFIALGGLGATTAGVSIAEASVAKLVGACIFPGGLAMVLLAGAELFTGNCLLSIPLLQREITVFGMLKNWGVVYAGNFVGGLIVAAIAVFSHQASLFNNEMAVSMISAAAAKTSLSFGDAFLKGIACNFLVCIAVWLAFAAKTASGKIISLFLPVMIFVLCGFEHSVANMYYIGAGLFAMLNPDYLLAATNAGIDVSGLNIENFLAANLLPVTLGNIVGGAICVGMVYWFVYLKGSKKL